MSSKEKKLNNSKILLKTSSSMPNIFAKKKKLDIKDFGLFTKYIDKQLSFYNIDPKELGDTQSIFNKTGMRIKINE